MAKSFSGLKRDGANAPMQVARSIQCYDSTAVAKTSPLAYADTILTITVPTNAVEIVMTASTDLRVSEASDMATGYAVQSAGITQVYPVSGMDYIYIVRNAASGTVQFYFHIV